MKIQEVILETVNQSIIPDIKPEDFKVQDLNNGKILISTTDTSGSRVAVIKCMSFQHLRGKNIPAYSKTGIPVSINFKSNGIIVKTTLEKAKEILERCIKAVVKELNRKTALKASAPERKKEASKLNYQEQKEKKEKLYATYGKDIIDRVKVKSLSQYGDDGYQWALIVDGRITRNGMTKYQAYGEQQLMRNYLRKLKNMTPEERRREVEIAQGIKAYFLYNSLEKQLDTYLGQINNIAKNYVDAKNTTSDVINKVSDKEYELKAAAKETKELLNRLANKN